MKRQLVNLKSFWPGIAWFFITAILLLIPSSDLPETEGWLHKIFFDKWVHASFFGLLSVLFMLPLLHKKLSKTRLLFAWILIPVIFSAWGYGVELLQKYYVPSRSYEIADWVADTVGCVLAFLFCRFIMLPLSSQSNNWCLFQGFTLAYFFAHSYLNLNIFKKNYTFLYSGIFLAL